MWKLLLCLGFNLDSSKVHVNWNKMTVGPMLCLLSSFENKAADMLWRSNLIHYLLHLFANLANKLTQFSNQWLFGYSEHGNSLYSFKTVNDWLHFKQESRPLLSSAWLLPHWAFTSSVHFQERKGTAKLDFLKKIELEIQERWEKEKAFENDAPTTVGESTK